MKHARLWGVLLALCIAAIVTVASATNVWQVARSVRLLTKPSSTTGQRIKTLHPPERVVGTGGKNGDYVRVQDADGDVGWVYEPYLADAVAESDEDGSTVTPWGSGGEPPVGLPESGGLASAISPSWEKPEPQTTSFHLHGKDCGPAGDGDETETNRRKNRIDIPTMTHAVTFEAVDNLPYPVASTKRSDWTAEQLAAIAPFEGEALTVTGYLVALKPQAGSSEACNCGWTAADETDWHMALVGQAGEPEEDALVVETTPRIRLNHPQWTVSNLTPWVGGPEPIRVSGWLLMDPQHKGHLKGHVHAYRNTLWEIHPITKIEVMRNGVWVNLDAIQAGPS